MKPRRGVMVQYLMCIKVMLMMIFTVERAASQLMPENMLFPLANCDFHFKGYRAVPPIFNLQDPGLRALSTSIITRDGQSVRSAATAAQCVFPASLTEEQDGEEVKREKEAGELCAEHFHIEADKLATNTVPNITNEWYRTRLKGRHVVLPLTSVDLLDGTQLRAGDGNHTFPERRRCVSFFTADLTSMFRHMLNKSHRKKLSKITRTAQHVKHDFNALLVSVMELF